MASWQKIYCVTGNESLCISAGALWNTLWHTYPLSWWQTFILLYGNFLSFLKILFPLLSFFCLVCQKITTSENQKLRKLQIVVSN